MRLGQMHVLGDGVVVDVDDGFVRREAKLPERVGQPGPDLGRSALVVVVELGDFLERQPDVLQVGGQAVVETLAPPAIEDGRPPRRLARQRGVERPELVLDHPGDAAAIEVVVEDGEVHGSVGTLPSGGRRHVGPSCGSAQRTSRLTNSSNCRAVPIGTPFRGPSATGSPPTTVPRSGQSARV